MWNNKNSTMLQEQYSDLLKEEDAYFEVCWVKESQKMQGVWVIPDQVVCATTFPDKEVKHDTTGWAPYIGNTGDLLGKLRFSENLTIAQGSELAHKNKEPFIGVCGALHLEDIWPLFTGSDPLGLRGRMCFF